MGVPLAIDRGTWRLRLLVSFVATLLSLAGIGVAFAHANLVRSEPPAGALLPSAPADVKLWFSEDLEPRFSQAVIYDSNRQRIDRNDSHLAPDDPSALIVGVTPGLPSGTYVVAWQTQSKVDGHIVRGTVPFGVGVANLAASATASAPNAPGSGSPTEMILRWLVLLSAALLVGGFAFWLLQSGLSKGTLPIELSPPMARQIRVVLGAGAVFLVGNLALLLLQATLIGGAASLTALATPIVEVLVESQYGELLLVRMLLGAGLIGLLALSRDKPGFRQRLFNRAGVVLGAATLATITLTSHSAASGTVTPLGTLPVGTVVDLVHVTAATIWVGGLAQLAILVPAIIRLPPAARPRQLLGGLVQRFSIVAGVALAALLLSGLVEAILHVGTSR